ncbi:hypothetical protein SO694_00004116 [Aureococcus anophagefferens]|uniref:Uncharacterized protein n=1 Tax=Aureococcus anophagefferens TaxID=44056 RepID=A0ABR1G9B8_AURAN
MITASLVCNTNNHGAADRGPAVAALLACFSLSSGFFGAWLAVVFAPTTTRASLRFLAFATLVGGTAGALGTAALDRAAKAPPRPHAAAHARAGVVALVAASAVGFLAAVSLALRVLGAPGRRPRRARARGAEDAEAEALIAGDDDGPPAPPKRKRPRSLRLSEAAATKDVEADDDPAATTRLVALFAAATTLSKLAVGAAALAVEAARKRGRRRRAPSSSPSTPRSWRSPSRGSRAPCASARPRARRRRRPSSALASGASWVLARRRARASSGRARGAIHGSYSLLIAAASSALYARSPPTTSRPTRRAASARDSYARLAATFDVVIVLNVGAALCAALLESHLRARPSKNPPTVVTK